MKYSILLRKHESQIMMICSSTLDEVTDMKNILIRSILNALSDDMLIVFVGYLIL